MTRKDTIILQIFTLCVLIGFTRALIGKRVHFAKCHQFPFVVSITKKVGINVNDIHQFHLCTGTLIRQRSILTAAHCLEQKKPEDILIIAGSVHLKEGHRYYPESWTTFDQWNHNRNWAYRMNDIAVIILKGDGITDITPALLPTVLRDDFLVDHDRYTIAGWGATEKGNKIRQLKDAQLTVISNYECSVRGSKLKGKNFAVPLNYFCSRGEPWILSSSGDGGAPVFTRENQVIGINVGVCPNLEGYKYSTEFLHQNQLNSHLHVFFYKNFIEHVWK